MPPNASELPDIYVSSAEFDDMGEILTNLGIEYRNFSEKYPPRDGDGVAMLNCGGFSPLMDGPRIKQFVTSGGSAIMSDYAGKVLADWTSATFNGRTETKTIDALIEDRRLVELLDREVVPIEFDLPGWKKPEQLPECKPLISNRSTGDVLAYQFPYGDGDVVYTAFHSHEQSSEIEEALLRLLVTIPIAESLDRTVKETYSSITKRGNSIEEESSLISTETSQDTEPDSVIRCPECGTENDPEDVFCKNADCGQKLN